MQKKRLGNRKEEWEIETIQSKAKTDNGLQTMNKDLGMLGK